jgi:hypothetical protein
VFFLETLEVLHGFRRKNRRVAVLACGTKLWSCPPKILARSGSTASSLDLFRVTNIFLLYDSYQVSFQESGR